LIVGAAAIVIVLSTLLGHPRHSKYKDTPYESGIAPTGDARLRTAVPYYLVAIFFIMFDVEVIFLYPWAVRLQELSWAGFAKALVFLIFVTAGLAYIWLRGGLAWRHLSRTASGRASSSRS
jgi:NADH-quinone oxidoreductase subunit A